MPKQVWEGGRSGSEIHLESKRARLADRLTVGSWETWLLVYDPGMTGLIWKRGAGRQALVWGISIWIRNVSAVY